MNLFSLNERTREMKGNFDGKGRNENEDVPFVVPDLTICFKSLESYSHSGDRTFVLSIFVHVNVLFFHPLDISFAQNPPSHQ